MRNFYTQNSNRGNSNATSSRWIVSNYLLVFLLLLGVNAGWSQTWTVGTGTTSTTTAGITPFSTYYHDGRTQYVYLASELTAAGATAGLIHQFGFDWSAAGGQAASNVNLKMANTTATNITALQAPTWTNVWSSASVSPTVNATAGSGFNLWTLTTPFNWNGTSNIIIEICFDNISYTSSWGVRTTQFATGISRTFGFYADAVTGCSMTTGSNATAGNRRNRPNARFVRLAPCTPSGNPLTYGTDAWIGYVYDAATPGAFTTYKGYVNEATTFNRTHTAATGATTTHCSVNQDLFTIRYRNTTNFTAGYYTFSVGGDDGVRFSIDGGATWLINNWIDQGYTVSSNPTPVYLSGNTNMVFEYYENGGGAQSSFSYIFTPACAGTPTPGNTIASVASVTSGGTSILSLQNATSPATYVWQSAPSSTGPWSTIAGATSATYTATVTATTWYRCVVTCTASSTSANSNAVQVTLLYCAPSSSSVDGTGITNVSFGTGPTVNNTTAGETNNYGDYSAQIGGLAQSVPATVSMTFNTGTYPYTTGIYVDWNNDYDFADAGETVWTGVSSSVSPNTLVATFTVPASTTVGGNYRMRIGGDDSGVVPAACATGLTYACFEDYTITVLTPPTCTPPTLLTSSTVTASSATISWTAASPAPASGYNYYVSTSATAPTAGTTPTGSTGAGVTTANLTGLTANTTYYFWVRSNCGGGNGTSVWAGSANFYTGYCIPAATTTACTYNLISNVNLNTLANNTGGCTGGVSYNLFPASGTTTTSLYQGGTFALNITLGGTTSTSQVAYWIDWNNNLLFDASEFVYVGNTFASGAIASSNIVVPAGTTPGTYRLRVKSEYAFSTTISNTSACTGLAYGETEDYSITITTPPACTPPISLVSSAVTTSSATISWTAPANAPASGYNYYVSTSATAPTGSTTPSGSTAAGVTTASITGLAANTTYYFWVQSNCGGGNGTSSWTGSSSFYTGYCVPTAIYTGTYFSNFVTTGGVTNISNNTNAISASGYGVFTSQSVSQYAGSSIGFQATIVGGTAGIAVFVDWNNDLDFADAGETVYSSNAYQSTGTTTSSFVVPAAAAAGNYTMRIVTDYNSTNPAACTLAYGQGEVEDYTVSVVTLTPCSGTPNPGATTAASTQVFAGGSTTLGITTVQTGTGITYQWQSGASATGPWTNIGGATAATYVASPTTATYYQCVVTCANGGVNGTSTPIQITVNPYCEPIYTYGKTDGDLISNISISGTTLSNNSGTAQTNPAYTFFTGQSNYTCDLVASNSYTVNVTVGTWGYQGIAAWIDYNDNNIFESSEMIGSTPTTIGTGTGSTPIPANHTASFTINLSCTPPLGTHRMRVRDVYYVNGPLIDPCGLYNYGETEDYLVTIIAGTAFTPVFTTTPAATSCVGTTVNYVATAGQTNYAWTFAGTAGTDYTVVSGGTSTSNTASVTWITGGAHSMTMNYASPLGCASSGAVSNTVTMPTAGSALANDAENATCTVNQNGWVHFYHSSGRLIGSINSQGQDLGAVTVTSYVDGTNALVPACANPNPIYSTSVMQRHWVITPTTQPTTPVLVRFPYTNAEFSGLTSTASTNANSNDDLLTPADLGMTKYSNGTAANVNSNPLDNCGVGTSTFHTQLGNGSAYSYSAVNSNYVDFSIPGFSEFWLHGSAQSSPLPVELVNFQANCAGEGKVNVTWATASEHNSANFTVEKSRDGINWSVLATVAGAGNSTQMINYSTTDNNAATGINYYRLTQTDFDGATETFNIASANCGDNSSATAVKVYPNPSAGDFYIDFTSEDIVGESIITITDSRGMTVYKQAVTVEKGSNIFHIENMEAAPGMYYIQVSNGTATSNIVKHSLR